MSGFNELNWDLLSHPDAEFTTKDNVFKIKIKSPTAVKTTFQLIQHAAGEKQIPEGVFVDWEKDDEISLRLALPEKGWYILHIFAKPIADEGSSLPGVFTYLINLTDIKKKVCPYPKQFADFKKGCLVKPRFIDVSKDLSKVPFKIRAPGGKAVAVKVGDEWFHLQNKGDSWEGDVRLEGVKGKDTKVTVNASMGDDSSQFSTLLLYNV